MTSAPTASINPPRMTTVPVAIGAPAAVMMRAPVMAYTFGVSVLADSVTTERSGSDRSSAALKSMSVVIMVTSSS